MKLVDLFAGCGGMSLGFQNAGFDIVAAYDNWQPAIDIYQQNFDHPIHKRDLAVENIVDELKALTPDIIIGGPPCQDFSIAGKLNLTGNRANLTRIYSHIIADVHPQWFVMENVYTIERSPIFAEAIQTFKNAGYGITKHVWDASYMGVPQMRKRYFVIGCLGKEDDFMLQPLLDGLSKERMTVRKYFGGNFDSEYIYQHPRNYKRRGIFSIDEPCSTIRSVNRPIPSNYTIHPADKTSDLSKVRPLTTKERSYIQTFPESFVFIGNHGAIEQAIGNAVPVKMAEYIAKHILQQIESMVDKQTYSRIGKILESVYHENWACSCPGCDKKAINTHYLQQRGILSFISSSHKYREVKYIYPTYWNEKDSNYEFKSKGIRQALSYPVFCSEHDLKLFRRIEEEHPNLDDYTNQLLFCFRTLCGDVRKAEIALHQDIKLLKSDDVHMPVNDSTPDHFINIMNSIKLLEDYKNELVDELNHPKGAYLFRHYSYPKLEVYASASMGMKTELLMPNGVCVLNSICFIHLIPQENSLEVLLGYPYSHVCREFVEYVEEWKGLDNDSLGWMITELFANRIENYGISEELYNQLPESKKEKLLRYMTRNIHYSDDSEVEGIDFNLFEDCINNTSMDI